jgi:hypothetical protein
MQLPAKLGFLRSLIHWVRCVILKILGIDIVVWNQKISDAEQRAKLAREEVFYLKSLLYHRLYQLPKNPISLKIEELAAYPWTPDVENVLGVLQKRGCHFPKVAELRAVFGSLGQGSSVFTLASAGIDELQELKSALAVQPEHWLHIDDVTRIARRDDEPEVIRQKFPFIEFWSVTGSAGMMSLSPEKFHVCWLSGHCHWWTEVMVLSALGRCRRGIVPGGVVAGYLESARDVPDMNTVMRINHWTEEQLTRFAKESGFSMVEFHRNANGTVFSLKV